MNASYYELMASDRLREARSLFSAVNRPNPPEAVAKTETRPEPALNADGWGWYRSLGRLLWAK